MLKQELAIYGEYRQRIGECDEQLQSCLRTFNLVSNLLKSKPYLERLLESVRVVRFLGPVLHSMRLRIQLKAQNAHADGSRVSTSNSPVIGSAATGKPLRKTAIEIHTESP